MNDASKLFKKLSHYIVGEKSAPQIMISLIRRSQKPVR